MRKAQLESVLLTGFGPFPGADKNVSADLVRAAARRLRRLHPKIAIHVAILPTEWERGPETLRRLYLRLEPALAVHFGISSKARSLVIETRANNRRRPQPDARETLPKSPLVSPTGPATLAVTLPVDLILRRLERKDIPHALSMDAGGYLCNAVLYHSLRLARRTSPRGKAGFVHIPPTLKRGKDSPWPAVLTWEAAVEGAVAIVETALDA
jgi:pyroglutamyl-peptidase